MPQAKGHNAHPTARALLERALESPRGIKVPFPTEGKAMAMRQQCYTVRTRDRARTRKIYDEDSPMFDTSQFDGLEMYIEENYLLIRPGIPVEEFGVEEL